MHDFLQAQHSLADTRYGTRLRRSTEALLGVMRSFDDDVVPFTATYRPSPRPVGRSNPKSKIQNRK